METATPISGEVAPGFEAIREEFAKNFRSRGDVGAAAAVYLDGQLIVDLWGGVADLATGREWARETVTLVYSVTKGATATLFNLLDQEGALDLDSAVAYYWPEFGANGKSGITIRMLLSHQAGLPILDENLTREELIAGTPAARLLARQSPRSMPGGGHGYHALTFGWLTGELLYRIMGTTLGRVFAAKIADPLGLKFWIGVPEETLIDYAPLIDGVPVPGEVDSIADPALKDLVLKRGAALSDPASLFSGAITTNGALPTPHARSWNDPRMIAAEQPGANGITNARSLAKMYAACVGTVDGQRLLSPATGARARTELVFGPDAVLLGQSRFGTGYQLSHPASPLLTDASFGHAGAGGALGFADPAHRIGFGYTQNQLSGSMLGEKRTAALIDALRGCLQELGVS